MCCPNVGITGCAKCAEKRKRFIRKGFVVAGVVDVTVFVAALAGSANRDDDEYEFDNDYADGDVVDEDFAKEIPYQPWYKVEFKAFKTKEWYTKTETDTGCVLLAADEEADAAELAAAYRRG